MLILILAAMATFDPWDEQSKTPDLENDRAFEGTWELVSLYRGLKQDESLKKRLIIWDGVWIERDNRDIIQDVTRTEGQPWPRIERRWFWSKVPWRPGHQGGLMGGGMAGGNRGIYHLDGDSLTIVLGPWHGPPPDDLEPAPERTVEVWKRVRNPRDERGRVPARGDEQAFEGAWECVSLHRGLEQAEPHSFRTIVWDGVWAEVVPGQDAPIDGAPATFGSSGAPVVVTLTPARPWPRIERGATPSVVQDRGIYHLDGDTVTIALGPRDGPVPDGLEPAPGRTVEVWKRIRDPRNESP